MEDRCWSFITISTRCEKDRQVKEHLLTLQGDQNDPTYMKLNPNGVVPTLVHDGNVITESSLILYYIDEEFPDPPLMSKTPTARHRVRLYNKLIDEYMHNRSKTRKANFLWIGNVNVRVSLT